MHKLIIAVLALSLTACGPRKMPHMPGPKPVVSDPQPLQAARDTFKGCKWQKVTGDHIHIWSFACGADMGNEHLVADNAVGGFDLVEASYKPSMVIRTFAKPAGALIDAALPAIRAVSPGKDTATCALVPAPGFDAWAGKLYMLEPTGAAKVAYDKANAIEPQDPPCGDLGIAPDGDRFFTVMPGDPTRVLYVDMGSEIQVFDPNTIGVN
jgi:hypothetical protein